MQENLKILLKYIVETFWDQLIRFDSLPSIQSLKVRYDQVFLCTYARCESYTCIGGYFDHSCGNESIWVIFYHYHSQMGQDNYIKGYVLEG